MTYGSCCELDTYYSATSVVVGLHAAKPNAWLVAIPNRVAFPTEGIDHARFSKPSGVRISHGYIMLNSPEKQHRQPWQVLLQIGRGSGIDITGR